MRGWLRIAVTCHLLIGAPSALAQGSATLDIADAELLLSLGTTAHVVMLDAGLRGIPNSRQELRRGVLFPIKPNTLALGFPKHLLSVDQLERMLLLTEDGLWGMAPLNSRGGSPFLLRETELRDMVNDSESKTRDWAVVRSRFPIGFGLVTFTRGEVFPIEVGANNDSAVALIEEDHRLTRSKFRQIEDRFAEVDNIPAEVERREGMFRVTLSIDHLESLELVDFPKVKDFLEEADAHRDQGRGWFSLQVFRDGGRFPELFRQWRKFIRLYQPFRVECNEQIEQVNTRITEASAGLTLGAQINLLRQIGLNLGPEAAIKATWGSELRKSSTLTGVSFDTDAYIVTAARPIIFQFGNAERCSGLVDEDGLSPKFYIATVPGIAGRAIDSAIMRQMAGLHQSIEQLLSGQLQASCLRGGYERIVDFMINDLNVENPIARLISSKVIKIDRSGEIKQGFFEC